MNSDDFDRGPLVDALRASLNRHAEHAPPGDRVAEQVLREAGRRPAARPTTRNWTLPLLAAAAVAAVVAGAAVVVQSLTTHTENGHPVANSVSGNTGTSTHSVPPSTATTPVAPAKLTNVRILDLTFVSQDEGWALASADCLTGSGRCTALLHTMDGSTWHSYPHPAFNVAGVKNCADPCVSNIRFVDPKIGYAYGPTALFMTTDGGQYWKRQSGGALFLESLDGNVIRITGQPGGCPGPCFTGIETAPNGSARWTAAQGVPTPPAGGYIGGFGMSFSRGNGGDAYLLMLGHVAGGGQDETSTLYRSTDNGSHWTSVGEPCPQTAGEVDSSSVAGAPDGRVSVLCTVRQAPTSSFVATSTDAGQNFAAQPGTVPTSVQQENSPAVLSGDPTTVLIVAGNGVAVSSDGGQNWTLAPSVTGQVTFAGFESTTVGRVVTDERKIWTTHDAGRTWTAAIIGN